MRAQEIRIADLLHKEQQFQIPLYQRPFSWAEKNWRRLWGNILEQADGIADGAPPRRRSRPRSGTWRASWCAG